LKVLENEKADAVSAATACQQKISAAGRVCEHLKVSEAEVESKIASLQEELALVREHASMQKKKMEDVKLELATATSQADMIDRTIDPLKKECDKIKLLYEHLVGNPL